MIIESWSNQIYLLRHALMIELSGELDSNSQYAKLGQRKKNNYTKVLFNCDTYCYRHTCAFTQFKYRHCFLSMSVKYFSNISNLVP